MYCEGCGYELKDGARFCTHCGRAVGAPGEPQPVHVSPPSPPASPKRPRRKGKIAAIAAGGVAAVLVLGVILLNVFDVNPAAVFQGDAEDVTDVLEAQESSLAAKSSSVEYQFRARGYQDAGSESFQWVVSEDLAGGAVVGTRIADYDGDGLDELLAVVWRNGFVDLEMYEVEDGEAVRSATLGDDASLEYTFEGNGALDVAVNADGAIYVQWWHDLAPVLDGHEWAVMRVDYDGEGFDAPDVSLEPPYMNFHADARRTGGTVFNGGKSALFQGTGIQDLANLKADMRDMGLDTSYVPDESSDNFTYSSIADADSSLTLVARAVAEVDDSSEALTIAQTIFTAGTDEWGDPRHLGTFQVGRDIEPPYSYGTGVDASIWSQVAGDYEGYLPSTYSYRTKFTLASDGSFTGMSFKRQETDDRSASGPLVFAVTYFSGSFTMPVEEDDGSYTMRLARLETSASAGENTPDEHEYLGGYSNSDVKFVGGDSSSVAYLGYPTSSSTGSYTLYLSGESTSVLGDEVLDQLYFGDVPETMENCVIVNRDYDGEERGFMREE